MVKIDEIITKMNKTPGGFASAICAGYVTISLGNHVKVPAVTEFTKLHGGEIHE